MQQMALPQMPMSLPSLLVSSYATVFTVSASCRSSAATSSPSADSSAVRDAEQHSIQHSSQSVPVQQAPAESSGTSIRPGWPSINFKPSISSEGSASYQTHSSDIQHGQQQLASSMQTRLAGSNPAQIAEPAVPTDISPTVDADSTEQAATVSQLCAQPEAFGYSERQVEEQQWSALFLQAYLQTQSQEIQPDNNEIIHLMHVTSEGSMDQQPAEPSEGGPLQLQTDAGSLQRHTSEERAVDQDPQDENSWLAAFVQAHLQSSASMQHADLIQAPGHSAASTVGADSQGPLQLQGDADSLQHRTSHNWADDQESHEGHSWLAAFTQAHLQGSPASMQHVESDQAREGCAASTWAADTDDESVAEFESQSVADSDDGSDSSTSSGLESALFSAPCPPYYTPRDKLHTLACRAVGLGYHAAGAAYGTYLGFKRGLGRP